MNDDGFRDLLTKTQSSVDTTARTLDPRDSPQVPGSSAASSTGPRPDLTNAVAWGPLLILEPVGGGSFGTVYRAWDPALDHEVALKRLRLPRVSSSVASAVVREGQLLARVRHQNVITVHGACEVDGEVGIWMDFLRGKTLESIVQEQGPMSAQEARIVGESVCRALAAVHLAGLLHRDVKASNVMREAGGRIVLLDFGTGLDLTLSGETHLAGTPLYLAPELFEGGVASVGSDIYSLGVLLFYLVTGTYPVQGATLADVREAHANGARALLSDARPDLPGTFGRVVEKALSPARKDRYASAGAMLRDLTETESSDAAAVALEGGPPVQRGRISTRRTVAYALASVAIAALAAVWWLLPDAQTPGRVNTAAIAPSIAVLPFVIESGEQDAAGFGEGIAEGLIRALEQLSSVRVLSSASSRSFSPTGNLRELGARLGVRAVVVGRFTPVPDGLIVAPELVDARDGVRLWTGDRSRVALGDLPSMARDVALRIASKLSVTVSQSDQQRLAAGGPIQSTALSKFLQGRRAAEGFTPSALRQAIQLFRAAKEEAPQFADADKGIAYCYLTYLGWMFSPREAMPNARIAAESALRATGGTDAEATAYLGAIAYAYDWKWPEAEAYFKKAVSADNPPATVHQIYASYLIAVGRVQEGLLENKKAIDRQPYDPDIRTFSGWLQYFARDNNAAIPELKQTVAMHDPYWIAHLILARVYEQQKSWPSAMAELRNAIEQSGGDVRSGPDITPGIIAEPYAELARWYALNGRRVDALKIVDQLEGERAGRAERHFPYIQPTMIAAVHAALGDSDRAFQSLREAADERDLYVTWINADPAFDGLRSDPRYGALLAEIHWPGQLAR